MIMEINAMRHPLKASVLGLALAATVISSTVRAAEVSPDSAMMSCRKGEEHV